MPEMDPIKNMISATDPVRNDPSVPDGEAALRRMLTEPREFSDSLPRNVVSLADRKHRRARLAGVLTLAAAAVTAGVLVATNLGALTTAPAPASTVTPTVPASPTVSASASASATPTPTPTATAAASLPAAAGPVACTKDSVAGVQSWFADQLPTARVAACAGDWMALSVQASGGQADAGSWFWMARLADRKYVFDAAQPWANVPGWEQAAANNDGLTAEQSMDREFADKGIPVDLRKALVGAPEPGSLAARGIKTYEELSTGYRVSFDYPATWSLADPSESISMSNGPGTALKDSTGRVVARLADGDTTDWSTSACRNNAPYKVLDSQSMPELPFDPAAPAQGTPRFVFVAMTSAADDGGPVQAGIGVTNRIAGQDGIGCVLDFAVGGPGALKTYSFTDRRPLGGPAWGLYKFKTMEEAAAFTRTQAYKDLKTVITSLTVTKVG
ncbi:hypothetical protein [Arthrobacter sp. H-02-3]|uniref:hypothetical protein n=1 Tax=Arthrobacter sp. H-02-3 TaxID=2703675 RepID=UPI00192A61D7|nr:hypothetical protein [Arthrobacter sp. H-02-3]